MVCIYVSFDSVLKHLIAQRKPTEFIRGIERDIDNHKHKGGTNKVRSWDFKRCVVFDDDGDDYHNLILT